MCNQAKHEGILAHGDDFLIVARPNSTQCARIVEVMVQVCKQLGVPLASDKTEGPATKLVFLGIELDSISQTLALPAAKLAEILHLLQEWDQKESCTVSDVQSLVGKLQFASNAFRPGAYLPAE